MNHSLTKEQIARVFAMYLCNKFVGYPQFKNSHEKLPNEVSGRIEAVSITRLAVRFVAIEMGLAIDATSLKS